MKEQVHREGEEEEDSNVALEVRLLLLSVLENHHPFTHILIALLKLADCRLLKVFTFSLGSRVEDMNIIFTSISPNHINFPLKNN